MRKAIVYASVHHGNTEKIVKSIAEECQVDAKSTDKEPRKNIQRDYLNIDPTVKEMLDEIPGLKIEIHPIFGFKEHVKEIETEYQVKIVIHREIPKSFCSDDETVDGNFRWQYKDFVACL